MGVFDKLKNVFFEEEYVEVEEPIRKTKKEKATIAKKVDLPEMPKFKEEKTPREIELEEEVVERVEKKGYTEKENRVAEKSFKFPMTFEDDDFKVDSYQYKKEEPKKHVEVEKEPKHDNLYGMKTEEKKNEYVHSTLYEGGDYKKEQKVFRPTPIISPIYGILDKNYKKEEIVQKKEVRLSQASSKKVDVDTVREKAYGDLVSDITASMMSDDEVDNNENNKENVEEVKNETTLYDLTDDSSPVVNSVTVGDAEEYFNDLGLEYNVDYKDHSKEKATGRRSDKNNSVPNETKEEVKNNDNDQKEVEDSLFDLIDSMYQDSEDE